MPNQPINQIPQAMTQIAISVIIIVLMAVFLKKSFEKLFRDLQSKQKNKFETKYPKFRPTPEPQAEIISRQPLTEHEKKMYLVLSTALPECIVLAQVAFSALVTTKSQATRNRFDRKVADFVLCSQGMNVIAIIELDDWSHKGRERQDADRDAMLASAGYTTIRYPHIPTTDKIRADIEALLKATRYG